MHGGAGDGDDSGTVVDELRCEVKVSVGKVLVANGALADARLVVSIARGVSGGSANAATQPMSSASLAPSLVGGREIVFNQTATLRCARLPERAVLRLCGSRVSVAGVRVSLEGDVEVPLAGCAAVASAMLRAADGDVAEGDLVATADAVVAAGDVRLPLVGADADAEADREQDAPEQAPGAGVGAEHHRYGSLKYEGGVGRGVGRGDGPDGGFVGASAAQPQSLTQHLACQPEAAPQGGRSHVTWPRATARVCP